MRKVVFTICAKNYIGLAQVLEKSILEYNKDIDKKIPSIIEGLAIKSDPELNLKADYEYYYKQKDDMSKLYIIHPLNSNLIYIFENFM